MGVKAEHLKAELIRCVRALARERMAGPKGAGSAATVETFVARLYANVRTRSEPHRAVLVSSRYRPSAIRRVTLSCRSVTSHPARQLRPKGLRA